MAQIIVRNLDETVKAQLRQRAIRHHRSMEEEARDILRNALKGEGAPAAALGSRLAARFANTEMDFDIPEQRGFAPQPALFDD
jgi:plasmid stability protein